MTDNEAKENIARNLERLLTEKDISQAELAKIAKENEMRISRYIRGVSLASSGALKRLAEALDVSTEYLLGNHTPRKTRKTA